MRERPRLDDDANVITAAANIVVRYRITKSGRRDVAKAVGELCASHAGGEGAGQRSEAMGIGVGASGGEEKKTGSAEAGRGGGGAEAGGAAARVVGEWG